ncbi:cell invasion protein [Pseudomonas sp. R37(2017)]|uniref:cell invasion protein n=1 Tax=Pseudomonas sp. R37(2017) TaxID=1981685 RepID=UPI000A1EFB35|nr:cell invasion protein [Pseudomonas sp. R37(2017)]
MPTIQATIRPVSTLLTDDSVKDAGLSAFFAQEHLSAQAINQLAEKQVLKKIDFTVPTAAQLESAIDAHQPSEADWQDFASALMMLPDEVIDDLMFDPGAWEKHANVLIAAIIALNVARVVNAQLRGHFAVMAAEAAKAQGAAIVESGNAAFYSAVTAAAVSGVMAGAAFLKTAQGLGLKHADINLHKRNALDAGQIKSDLEQQRSRNEWDPQATCKIKTFDDVGRSTSVDFKSKGSTLTPQEQAWFDGEILKAQKVGQTSDWLSQMGSKGIEKKLEIGRLLSTLSMNLGQVVSSLVRMTEHAAREKEVLQQSAQNTQKSLSDEVGQKDSADAALLQKIMDIVMQLFQSRLEVIRSL